MPCVNRDAFWTPAQRAANNAILTTESALGCDATRNCEEAQLIIGLFYLSIAMSKQT